MKPTRYYFPSPGFSKYWKEGNGKKLALRMEGEFPSPSEIEAHVPLLFEVDTLADAVIREVYQKVGFKTADQWINQLLQNEAVPEAPACLHQIIKHTLSLPKWVDESLLDAGTQLCRRSGTLGLMVLRNYCLMGGYESAAINKPLVFTGALKKGAAKRLTETTEYWVRIIGENAITNPKIGQKESLKIRLMHAYARVSILDGGKWEEAAWGAPLNQWDMLATNLGFTIVFLDGLRKLGMKITDEEVNGIFHFWKYTGYLLGIPPDILPNSESDAIKAIYSWTITQSPADADTIALAKALSLEPVDGPFPKTKLKKQLVYKIHLGFNRYFLGRFSCETMQLPQTIWRFQPYLLRTFIGLGQCMVIQSEKIREKSIKRNRKAQLVVVNDYLKSHDRNTIAE